MTAVPPLPAAVLGWFEERGESVRAAEVLVGDLSVRSYFRVHLESGETRILAIYPPGEGHPCRRFVISGRLLAGGGVPTPEVLAFDCEGGWMLLEDLGSETWFESHGDAPWQTTRALYHRALEYVRRIGRLEPAEVAELNPPLDAPALERELDLAWELVIVPEGIGGESSSRAAFRNALGELCRRLQAPGLVPAHRDFMVRNLVVVDDDRRLVVLDHQDLRLAPRGYDVASLLNDSLFPEAPRERELLLSFAIPEEGYRRAAVQRCLKAAGSYRRAGRSGRDLREPLIRPTLARAWRHFGELPELAALRPALAPSWERFLAGG